MTKKLRAIRGAILFGTLLLLFLPGCESDSTYAPPVPVTIPYPLPPAREDQSGPIAQPTPTPAVVRKKIHRKRHEASDPADSEDEEIQTLTKARDAREEEITHLKQDLGAVKHTVKGMEAVVDQQQHIIGILKEREKRLNEENDAIDKAIKEREDSLLKEKDGSQPLSE